MKGRLQKVLTVLVLTTLTIALSGCAGDKADGKTSADAAETSIVIGIPASVDTLDPHFGEGAGTREVLFNFYEGLVKYDSDGNLVPAVAQSAEVSEDGKTYTFTLRDNITFHDGTAVTTEDVIYSINRCADPDNGNTMSLGSALSNIADMQADGNKVVITLQEKDADFLAYMTLAILPAASEGNAEKLCGTGPYKVVKNNPGESVTAEAYDGYWGTKPGIQNVTFKVCASADSVVMDLEGGSIDMYMRLTADQVSQLSDDFTIEKGTMNLVQALYLNNADPLFQDERVRQALCYAVDRQQVLDFISNGDGQIVGSSMFPTFGKYYVPELETLYQQNVDKAKELLTEAGYPDGITFTVKVPSNHQPHIDTAQVLADQLKAAGVTMNIELIEWNSWLSDVYTARDYQATVVGVDASRLTAAAMLERFTSTAHNNFVNYSNAEYDAMYEKATNAVDDEERTQYYKECERILAETAANVYIQDMAEYVAIRKTYTGYTFYPLYVQDISLIQPAK